MSKLKILFLARHNLDQIGGGDKVQLLKTKAALERLGHQVDVSTAYTGQLKNYDIVHMFNMMISPHTFFIYTIQAQKVGVPIVLSTIYWNPSEWQEHAAKEGFPNKIESSGRFKYPFKGIPITTLLAYFISSSAARKWLLLLLKKPGGGQASAYVRKYLVGRVNAILPNGKSEGEAVEKDFTSARAVFPIPNGVDDNLVSGEADFSQKHGLGEDFVLHVGRIETRKNLLALVKAIRSLELPMVLIGNDQVGPAYTQAVKEAAGDKAVFIPEIQHEMLGSAYKAAKVHALASWFETPGLASLEAGLAGCNVVTTDRGTTKEYFSDLAWYCDPADQASIVEAVKQAWAAPKSTQLREHILKHFTWDEVAKQTTSAYAKVLASNQT